MEALDFLIPISRTERYFPVGTTTIIKGKVIFNFKIKWGENLLSAYLLGMCRRDGKPSLAETCVTIHGPKENLGDSRGLG